MSLRETLTPPMVVEPTSCHTHTVIFLHRCPEGTGDDELLRSSKVLALKRTKDHKTLREQFPSVRWVFPHAKVHAGGQHWSHLSAEDMESALGLDAAAQDVSLPYITRVVLQEAERPGADKVVLGGQGDTAEAAHDAMARIPGPPRVEPDDENKHSPLPHQITRLAGFVGMHAADGPVTRDVRAYGISRKLDGEGGDGIVASTPHEFIKGGYKVQTATWDGRRIDDFAAFLESVHVRRVLSGDGIDRNTGMREILTPRERPGVRTDARASAQDELDEKQKYALEIARQKAAADEHRLRILHRIEADKVERKIKTERERQARLYRAQAQQSKTPANVHGGGGVYQLGGHAPRPVVSGAIEETEVSGADAWAQDEEMEVGSVVQRQQFSTAYKHGPRRRVALGRRAGEGEDWVPRSQIRGEMTDGQTTAFGLAGDGEEAVEAE